MVFILVAEIILVTAGAQADAMRQGAAYVARNLSAIGHKVREQISVCETQKQLVQAISTALNRSHILVTIGGLSMASSYMAKNIISQGLRLPLEMNGEALSTIKSYCYRTGDPYSLEDNALAQLPRGSVAFPGNYGKIPGYVISSSKQHIVQLPETPAEIIPMFNKYVSPYLGGVSTTTVTRTVRTYGATEQVVRANLAGMFGTSNPVVTIHKEAGEVLVRVAASAETSQQASSLCTPLLHSIVEKLGDAAYGLDVESLQSAVISKLAKKNLEIAIAEAGTDGMLTRVLTETEGGQGVLRYSVAVDDDKDKTERLGIKAKLLRKRGGSVSEYAAVAMAAAAREKAHTDIGAAICAVDEENAKRKTPFGLVYIAVCDNLHVYVKKLVIGDGDAPRDIVVDAAISRALNMIRLFVDYLPARYPAAAPLNEVLNGLSVTDKDNYDDGADLDTEPDNGDSGEGGEKEPKKRGGAAGMIRRVVLVLAILVFVGSSSYVGYTLYQSWHNKKMAEDLANMFTFGEMGDVEVAPDYPQDYSYKFAGLWNVNRDVRAFINIPETGVRYPIVQSSDNEYYLRRDFYGNHNQHGVPYFDFRVNPERPSDNMVVYGHNMTDGQIFGEIIQYKELEFYQAHPVIDLSTVYEDAQYKIFSVFITNAFENQGHVFDYYNFIDAESDSQFASFLEQLRYRTIINTTVDVEPGDQLITLSTCSYEFKDARLVVVARKVRRGEKSDVDVTGAALNPQPLYPDVWYTVFGGSPPAGLDGNWSVGQNASLTAPGYGGDDAAPAATRATAPTQASAVGQSSSRRQSSSSEAATQATQPVTRASEAATQATQPTTRATEATTEPTTAPTTAATEATTQATEATTEPTTAPATEASTQATEDTTQPEVNDMPGEDATDPTQPTTSPGVENMSFSHQSVGQLTVIVNGARKTADAAEIVAGIVQNEVGASFHTEAIKAQAVAAYTFVAQSNQSGSTPTVYLSTSVPDKVKNAVQEVMGQAVYYNGSLAFTPYHATSAGQTTSSATVWGGNYPYLVSVDSSVDSRASGFKTATSFSSDKVADLISSRLGISVSGDPSGWIQIQSYTDGGYVGNVTIGGQSKSAKTGSTLTGRLVRETVFNLRSACFEVDYDSGSDKFTFTTYGYGHGVGLSQNGANLYANQGWSYIDILEHYFPGTTVG